MRPSEPASTRVPNRRLSRSSVAASQRAPAAGARVPWPTTPPTHHPAGVLPRKGRGAKLVALAGRYSRAILTNDFNLNKVAQLHGVDVLNINELANALKPIVLPGEIMKVFILKEGKEYNQGVAYLDDGTMVVVDNAKKMISKTIDIAVTSVLQTTAGKMIFGKYDERRAAEPIHQ